MSIKLLCIIQKAFNVVSFLNKLNITTGKWKYFTLSNTYFIFFKNKPIINQTGAQLPLVTNDITAVHRISMATTDSTHPLSYWYEHFEFKFTVPDSLI